MHTPAHAHTTLLQVHVPRVQGVGVEYLVMAATPDADPPPPPSSVTLQMPVSAVAVGNCRWL